MFGKAIGALGAIATTLGPVFLLGVLALLFAPGGASYLPHALTLAVVYGLYGVVFLFLTLAVSAALPTSKARAGGHVRVVGSDGLRGAPDWPRT